MILYVNKSFFFTYCVMVWRSLTGHMHTLCGQALYQTNTRFASVESNPSRSVCYLPAVVSPEEVDHRVLAYNTGFVGKTNETQLWGNVFNYTHSHQVGVVDNEAVRTVVCFPMCLLTKKSSPGVGRLLVGSVRADLTFSTPESVTSFLLARVQHKPSLIPSSACSSGLVKLFCTQGPSTTLLKAIYHHTHADTWTHCLSLCHIVCHIACHIACHIVCHIVCHTDDTVLLSLSLRHTHRS